MTTMETDVAEATSTLQIMDHTGHTEIKWDPNVEIEVAAAKAAFDVAKAKGMVAYRMAADGTPTGAVIREFDPQARKIVLRPALQGG